MWRPANVVPEHRTRATVIWGALLLAIAGYTTWQVAKLHRKFENPSTSFSVSDDVYPFPRVTVCVWGGRGCDESQEDSWCIRSAISSVYDPCGNLTEGTNVTSEWDNCLQFDLSTVDMQGFVEDGCGISWITSLAPDEEEEFRDTVGVFLGNESPPEYVTVPYSRIVKTPGVALDDITRIETDVTIGRSTRNNIQGNSTTSYPVLSVSISDLVDQHPDEPTNTTADGGAYAIGYLRLSLTQGGFSLTELTDVNPLDIGSLLGNIGGFWELLLVVWGLCFVAELAQSPTARIRNFNRQIEKGRELIGRKRRRVTIQASTPDLEDGGEEQPSWIAAAGSGRQEAPGGGTLVTPPTRPGSSMKMNASSFRRPIPQDFPMRLAANSSRWIIRSDSFVASGDEESKSQQHPPPV